MAERRAILQLNLLAWGGFAALVLVFLALKSFCLHWQLSDENIYYYMAAAAHAYGVLPYRDYFFAHPPLHLLPGIALFALLGFSPLTARALPIGATLVAATCLFLLAKQHLGRRAAVAVVALHLNSLEVLADSTHWTGVNCAVMWLVIGMWALLRRRAAAAGVLFALGVCTGNYILPAAVMAGTLAFLESRATGVRYLLGFAVPWLVVQAGGLELGGHGYVDSVYRFHFAKQPVAASAGMFYQVFTDNFALFLGSALGLVLAEMEPVLARVTGRPESLPPAAPHTDDAGLAWVSLRLRHDLLDDGARSVARIGALFAGACLLFIAMLPVVFPFYLLPAFPGLALTAGFAVERFVHHASGLLRAARRRDLKWWEAARILGMIVVATWVGYTLRVPLQRGLVPSYVRSQDTPMKWSNSPLPINALVRWCCWDDVARSYTAYGTVQESLYHESRYFETAGALSDYVHHNSRPEQKLFGDSSSTGIVALLAERRIAADFADTNIMRFSSGIVTPADAIQQIDSPALAFVLVRGRVGRDPEGSAAMRYEGFAALPAFRHWLDDEFEIAFQVADRTKGAFLLLKRKQR